MVNDATELQKLIDTVKYAHSQGVPSKQVEEFLQKKGSSLQEVAAANQYGIENFLKTRQDSLERQAQGVKSPDNPSTGEYIKGMIGAGVESAAVPVEDYLNIATGGGYNWLNKKIGGTYEERAKDLEEAAGDIPYAKGTVKGIRTAAKIAGIFKNPLYSIKAIPAGSQLANLLKYDTARNIANAAIAGGIARGAESGFESDWNLSEVGKGAKKGAIIGGAVGAGSELVKQVAPKIFGATTKTSSELMETARDAGIRKSKAFRQGRNLTPDELVEEAAVKTNEIKQKAVDKLTQGKNSIGKTKIDTDYLLKEINKAIPVAIEKQPGAQREVIKATQELLDDFGKTDRTLLDLDRLRQNVRAINVGSDATSKALRNSLYSAVKSAGDKATNGQYSNVLKPYEETSKVLQNIQSLTDIGKASENASTGTMEKIIKKTFKSAKTQEGFKQIKDSFGQEYADKLAGYLTKEWFGNRAGWQILGAISGGFANPLMGATAFGAGSPRVTSTGLYWGSRLAPTVESTNIILNKLFK